MQGQGQRVEEVPVERLRFGLSPRTQLCDARHVATLAEVIDDVPPIVVHASTLRVVDGVHRVHAARALGRSTIRAVLFDGDESDAQIEAVRSNVAHGKPLSLAEREAAARRILALVPDWSDRRVAVVSGLSPKTVGRLRARATVDSAQSRARVGRDGRLRPVDPSEVRRRVADVVRADPDASTRSIASRTGASQATVRDVRQRLSRGASELLGAGGRRRKRKQSDAPSDVSPVSPVPADVVASDFAAWFEQRSIEDAQWQRFVRDLPISRVYEVADACRRHSASWRAFAIALEDRARAHRRSGGAVAAEA
jgi:ParB-like chromosome segregation protein Spo0J